MNGKMIYALGAALSLWTAQARAAEPAAAMEQGAQGTQTPQDERPLFTEPVSADRRLVAYRTESGGKLPLLSYPAYQKARTRWTAGFATTWAGLALCGTGVGALLLGGYGGQSLTLQGQNQAFAAGGVLTAVGLSGVVIGAVVWSLGRRDLHALERGLSRPQLPAERLSPAMGLWAAPGSGGLVLSGSF